MNWFKRSIAYDQVRRLKFLPIFIIIPIIISLINLNATIKSEDKAGYYNNLIIGIGNISFVVIIGVIGVISIVSIGIRDKSEVIYMESLPMKPSDVVRTKLFCASTAAVVPLLFGFLLSTIVYIINKDFLVGEGYLYLDIVYRYVFLIMIAFVIICTVYLASILYKSIKVSIVLGVIGVVSTVYLIIELGECFKYNSPINMGLHNIVGKVIGLYILPINSIAVYDLSNLGFVMILIGIGALLYGLIRYITSNFNNDIYDNLFAFKVSKWIYYIVSVFAIMTVVNFVLHVFLHYIYIEPILRTSEKVSDERFLVVYRIEYIVTVVFLPIWILISRKIGRKLEERF